MEVLTRIIVLSLEITIGIVIYCKLLVFIKDFVASLFANSLGVTSTLLFFNFLTFPGVMHHELSHAFFAFITGAKVCSIDLFHLPKDGSLGSVSYIPRGPFLLQGLQMSLSSIAPSVTPLITVPFLYKYAQGLSGTPMYVVYYLILSILAHIGMSDADFKGLIKGLIQTFIIIIILVTIYILFNPNLYIITEYLNNF